jgi:hypothetical protein
MPVLKIKKADNTWQEVWGCMSAGSGDAVAPKLTSITMSANAWTGSNNPYSQVVTCSGVNVNSKLDLQPTPTQIVELQDAEISLMLTNTNGVVTAWAIGGKPTNNYTMDVLITEVTVV